MSAQTAVGWATRETEVILIHPGIEPFVGLGAGGLSLRRTPCRRGERVRGRPDGRWRARHVRSRETRKVLLTLDLRVRLWSVRSQDSATQISVNLQSQSCL